MQDARGRGAGIRGRTGEAAGADISLRKKRVSFAIPTEECPAAAQLDVAPVSMQFDSAPAATDDCTLAEGLDESSQRVAAGSASASTSPSSSAPAAAAASALPTEQMPADAGVSMHPGVELANGGDVFAQEVEDLIRNGELSCVELTRMYIARLRKLDETLHCVIEFTEERALAQAVASASTPASPIWLLCSARLVSCGSAPLAHASAKALQPGSPIWL